MFSSGKGSKPQNRIDCLIGAGTTIEGNITFTGGLRVDGHVKGNIVSVDGKPATLVLSDQARVEGEVRVSHVVINGTIIGPVYAHEYAELQLKANVTGDVYYVTLEMQHGAVVQGRLVHYNEAQAGERLLTLKPEAAAE